jgi:hypothetical protein
VNSGLVKLEDLGIDLTVPDGNQDMATGGIDPLSDDGQ